jgi:hypothetical protein
MRNRLFLSLIAAASFLAVSSAQAGTLTSATWTQELQGIALTVTNAGATCTDTNPGHVASATVLTCPTAGLQATGTSTATSYNVGLTMPLFEVQAFTTGGTINIGTHATLQGAQNITGNAASATATVGIMGTVTVGGAMHTMNSAWTQPAGQTLVQIPLSVGKAGTFTGTFLVLGSYHYITVDFYAWTPGTVTFTGLTTAGMALPNVVAMGTFNLDANGAGTVTLVSPSKISIDGPAAQRRTAGFTTLKLTFTGEVVPEPSTLLLLGAGAIGLLLVGNRKSN